MYISKTYSNICDNCGNFIKFVSSPKTSCSTRIIPIPPFLLKELKRVKQISKSQYVVSTKQCSMISPRSYQKCFKRIIQNAGVSNKNFHSLRHTFATRALENGMDIKTLSEIMGHKNPTTTLNIYTHSMLESKKKMINNLGKISIYTKNVLK